MQHGVDHGTHTETCRRSHNVIFLSHVTNVREVDVDNMSPS
jgi:hypothetical protein